MSAGFLFVAVFLASVVHIIQFVVGGLLLVFGLQWLRKAMLRASGTKAKPDEDAIYKEQVQASGTKSSEAFESYSFRIAFMGVLLEGLEVAFIVLTFSTTQGNISLAVIAVAAATRVGVAVRAPLARVPENGLKFAVGLLRRRVLADLQPDAALLA